MTKLYIGNLPYSYSEEDIKKLLEEFSPSNVTLITDRETGRSKGFAFAEIEDDAAAQTAIEKLNGHEVDGRALVVNVARPKTN